MGHRSAAHGPRRAARGGRAGVLGVPVPPLGVPLLRGWFAITVLVAGYAGMGLLLARWGRSVPWGDGVLLLLGLGLDLATLQALDDPRARQSAVLAVPWLLFWLGWQAVAAAALVRHLRGRRAGPPAPRTSVPAAGQEQSRRP